MAKNDAKNHILLLKRPFTLNENLKLIQPLLYKCLHLFHSQPKALLSPLCLITKYEHDLLPIKKSLESLSFKCFFIWVDSMLNTYFSFFGIFYCKPLIRYVDKLISLVTLFGKN